MRKVYQDLREETKSNNLFVPILLVLLTIPLNYAYNSVSVCVFTGITLLTFKKNKASLQKKLLPLMLLYVLMVISITWSWDVDKSVSSIVKELPLFAIPFCFFIYKPFTTAQVNKILKYYSFGMVCFAIFYLIRATIRFITQHDYKVFFYHGLVTEDLNAIHVSIFIAMACFYFIDKKSKGIVEIAFIILLSAIIFMLASKNVMVIFLILVFLYFFFYAKISNKIRYVSIIGIIALLVSFSFVKQIRERFLVEINTNITENTLASGSVMNTSIRQAWTNESFTENNYFPGAAFRVYQVRIFLEMIQEDSIFFTGYGLNASHIKIEEKARQYKIHPGYATYNFHNQYIQNFAELGIFGLLLLLILLYLNTQKAFSTKNFVHIAFAILMMTLFLTESFLWRQRGVIYFTVLYCLFNANSQIKAKEKTT